MTWMFPQEVPAEFQRLWRRGAAPRGAPPAHVGPAKPTQVVQIRKGRYHRDYYPWSAPLVNAAIPGETSRRPWRAKYVAETDWTELEGVLEVSLDQSFDSNGISSATITVENVGMAQQVGPLGDVYHLIEHGYLAPFRGYRAPTRPRKGTAGKTEWFELLARSAQIRVWQGYGQPDRDDAGEIPSDGGENGAWTFVGLIEEIDPESHPDRITISCRDHGKMLTDQRLFGFAKAKGVIDPVIFVDRHEANGMREVGGAAEASSAMGGHPARFVSDDVGSSAWRSTLRTVPDATEWVQVRLPAGHYDDIVIEAEWPGMECFIGLNLKDRAPIAATQNGNEGSGASFRPPLLNGQAVDPGWLDVGKGDVPGESNGGWPFVRRIARLGDGEHTYRLGVAIDCGDNTILRVGFRRLHRIGAGYRAGVTRLVGRKVKVVKPTAGQREAKLVVVDDVSDVVRVVLRWAGFTEWDVEDTGVRLKGRALFNRSSYLIEPIQKAVEQTGFVFFIGDPADGDSLGVPVFHRNRALSAPDDIPELRDTDLLTGIKVKVSEEPLSGIIRVRGKQTGDRSFASHLGGDFTRRIMAVYRPPWNSLRENRLGGVLKHVTHTQPELRTFEEAMVACYLLAINEALQAVTAVVEAPAHPGFNLDDQAGILDTGTGMNTRLWITNRTSTFTAGENARWTMSLGGSMIDTPDMVALVKEIDTKQRQPPFVTKGRGPL